MSRGMRLFGVLAAGSGVYATYHSMPDLAKTSEVDRLHAQILKKMYEHQEKAAPEGSFQREKARLAKEVAQHLECDAEESCQNLACDVKERAKKAFNEYITKREERKAKKRHDRLILIDKIVSPDPFSSEFEQHRFQQSAAETSDHPKQDYVYAEGPRQEAPDDQVDQHVDTNESTQPPP